MVRRVAEKGRCCALQARTLAYCSALGTKDTSRRGARYEDGLTKNPGIDEEEHSQDPTLVLLLPLRAKQRRKKQKRFSQ